MRDIEPLKNEVLIFIKITSNRTSEFHYKLKSYLDARYHKILALNFDSQFEINGLFSNDWKETKVIANRLSFKIKIEEELVIPKDRHNVKAPNVLYQYNTDYSEYSDFTATRNSPKS
jgi:hypothetical protein